MITFSKSHNIIQTMVYDQKTRKLPSRVKGLSRRNLTATTLIYAKGTGMELPWLLAPEVACEIWAQVNWTQVSLTLGH